MEGGKFSVSPVDVDFELDEVTSVAFVIDEGQEQRTWRVVSLRDNVISSLRIPTWPIPGSKPVTEADVLDAGRHAAKLLAAAGPASREAAQTTTTTVPVTTTVVPTIEDDPEHLKPGVNTDVTPDDNTDPTPDEPLPKDLFAIALDDGDLSADWKADEPEQYRANPTSSSDLAECPEMAAFDAIDAVLVMERRFARVDYDDLTQFLGRASDSATAAKIVTGFGDVVPCIEHSFEEQVQGEGDLDLRGEFSIVEVETAIDGADAVSHIDFDVFDERFTIVVIAVDDVVSVLTFNNTDHVPPDETVVGIAEVAAAKIRNG